MRLMEELCRNWPLVPISKTLFRLWPKPLSVLERRKEIGILRAIGASKRNVGQVFNAETFIIGALAGLIGIGVTEILIIPTNIIIGHVTSVNMQVSLPVVGGIVLAVCLAASAVLRISPFFKRHLFGR